jgi:RNA polymerase sigma-70 factor (ECF subfamily)
LLSSDTDIELWDAAIKGDHHAFGGLFHRHYKLLFQYGSKICNDPVTVEDTIQELFIDLWNKRPEIAVRSVKAYLLQALKFKLYKYYRAGRPDLEIEQIQNEPFEISHETFMINSLDHHERSNRILDALKGLSPRQKEIIYLKIYKGLSYEEVSEIMQMNYQATRNLLCLALKAIRKLMVPLLVLFIASYSCFLPC